MSNEFNFEPANCKTVADVMLALGKMPPETKVKTNFANSVDVVLFNQGDPSEHVTFEDGNSWT